MHVLLHPVADFCGGFAENPHQEGAGGYPYYVCKEIQRVGIAVGGKGPLGVFSECGKGQACDQKQGIYIAVADFYVLVVGTHEPSCNRIGKIH